MNDLNEGYDLFKDLEDVDRNKVGLIVFDFDSTFAPHYERDEKLADYIKKLNWGQYAESKRILEVLKKKGISLVILSNNYVSNINPVLKYMGLDGYFKEVLGGSYRHRDKGPIVKDLKDKYSSHKNVIFMDDYPEQIEEVSKVLGVLALLYSGKTIF